METRVRSSADELGEVYWSDEVVVAAAATVVVVAAVAVAAVVAAAPASSTESEAVEGGVLGGEGRVSSSWVS